VKPYKNLNGNSGVTAYEIGEDFIAVQFGTSVTYWYSFDSPGAAHVIEMKRLAKAGRGLAEYIATHPAVREGYQRKG
jgi:hypothetical protein